MLTFLVALLSGALVGAIFRLANLVHSVPAAVTPAVIATFAATILLFRRAGKHINPIVDEAQRHLQAGRRELALKSLRAAMAWNKWHPLLAPQLRTQIGVLLYAEGKLDEAIPELEQASSKPWESPAFLGCALFKQRADDKPMEKAFERAVKTGAKDGLSWTVYAWCLNARGKKDEALAVLKRGLEKNPGDQRLQNNIELVQEGKKLKVAPYAERWAAFALDGGIPQVPKGARGMAQRPGFRPGFRQKPQRKR